MDKEQNCLFILEGRNGLGFYRFLNELSKATTFMHELEVKVPPPAIKQASCEIFSGCVDSEFVWDPSIPQSDGDDSFKNDISISGFLLQVDIERSASVEKSLDYFENTMTNGVDSLSQFLIREFE
ncbi:unnamed protein product [Cuscuta epithymum]|uniref:Uncharacterized protein n=1 Tax=Cuscuta epithymum TaxID=186058 RepID=A0AAV0CDU3_9ASTE|nr:unnamed protein product [Cuscuta epithymum]